MEDTAIQLSATRSVAVDEELERQRAEEAFLFDYRQAGLAWAAYACMVASALVALFIVVPGLSLANRFAPHVLGIRLGMISCLFCVLFALSHYKEFSIRNYAAVVGGACMVLLGGIVVN